MNYKKEYEIMVSTIFKYIKTNNQVHTQLHSTDYRVTEYTLSFAFSTVHIPKFLFTMPIFGIKYYAYDF